MPKHLVFLIGEDWFFASHFVSRARAAREAGWRVTVLTRVGPASASLREEGFDVIGVDFVRARINPFSEFLLFADIVRQYRLLKPDVVHHVALKAIVLGTLAASIAGVRSVVNAPVGQGFVFVSKSLKARLLRPFVRLALQTAIGARGAFAIFENSEDQLTAVASGAVPNERAILIPGAGVDLERFRPHSPSAGVIKVVLGARMLLDKGVREYIEAGKILHERGNLADLVLAGTPDPENPGSLPDSVLRGGSPVRWIGRVGDMAALLRSAHIACLPSYREGLPLFLLEAMASGLPVVATDVTGCRDAVVRDRTGLLVPPRDPVALADALAKLISDSSMRASFGAAGRARAEALYGQSVICSATLAVYERAIGEGEK